MVSTAMAWRRPDEGEGLRASPSGGSNSLKTRVIGKNHLKSVATSVRVLVHGAFSEELGQMHGIAFECFVQATPQGLLWHSGTAPGASKRRSWGKGKYGHGGTQPSTAKQDPYAAQGYKELVFI